MQRKFRQWRVIKLLIEVSPFSPFSAYCLLGAGTHLLPGRWKELEKARIRSLWTSPPSGEGIASVKARGLLFPLSFHSP